MAGGEGAAAATRRLLGALCLCAVAGFHLVHGRETGAEWTLEKVGHVCVSQALLASPLGCGEGVAARRQPGISSRAAVRARPRPPRSLATASSDPASGANPNLSRGSLPTAPRGAGPVGGERR